MRVAELSLARFDLKTSGAQRHADTLHLAAIVFAAAGTRLPKVGD
mgnify:CR=1 FL=1